MSEESGLGIWIVRLAQNVKPVNNDFLLSSNVLGALPGQDLDTRWVR